MYGNACLRLIETYAVMTSECLEIKSEFGVSLDPTPFELSKSTLVHRRVNAYLRAYPP